MTIRCQCENCGASLKVKDKLAGTEGKCPKCKGKLLIPEVSSDDSAEMLLSDDQKPPKAEAHRKTAEEEEEDAIFGDDFFKLQEPEPRSRYVPPVVTHDEEDDEPEPQKKTKSKSHETEIGAEIESGSGGNAASIASSLLSKSGKRNRPEDFKDPTAPEEVSYDYSEINYLLLQRVLPGVGAAIVVFFLAYWMFSDSMGGGSELPELAELTGHVTENGQGVAAFLRFSPALGPGGNAAGQGSPSTAFANEDGEYEVFYTDDVEGLVLGTHEVQIMVGSVTFTREVTIEAGSQVIDFELAE